MKTFRCQCGNRVFFLNSRCVNCSRDLGYFPRLGCMGALDEAGPQHWTAAGITPPEIRYRKCNNYAIESVCNWMLEAEDPESFCWSCRLNSVIPDLSRPRYREYWYKIECAKRHMLYGLYQLRLPVISKKDDAERGLAFTFLADSDSAIESDDVAREQEAILTGHRNGMITLNLAEADDVARARIREQLQERYRTLLGHFRHEIGHYYWDRLVRDSPAPLNQFRQIFGDERRDYEGALQLHYQNGPPVGWQMHYLSSYASMHPWEDWAECWAHYMHMVDTLETAHDLGLTSVGLEKAGSERSDTWPSLIRTDFARLLDRWVEFTVALNAISHSMGLADAYPFVLPPSAEHKLQFIHQLIADQSDH